MITPKPKTWKLPSTSLWLVLAGAQCFTLRDATLSAALLPALFFLYSLGRVKARGCASAVDLIWRLTFGALAGWVCLLTLDSCLLTGDGLDSLRASAACFWPSLAARMLLATPTACQAPPSRGSARGRRTNLTPAPVAGPAGGVFAAQIGGQMRHRVAPPEQLLLDHEGGNPEHATRQSRLR